MKDTLVFGWISYCMGDRDGINVMKMDASIKGLIVASIAEAVLWFIYRDEFQTHPEGFPLALGVFAIYSAGFIANVVTMQVEDALPRKEQSDGMSILFTVPLGAMCLVGVLVFILSVFRHP